MLLSRYPSPPFLALPTLSPWPFSRRYPFLRMSGPFVSRKTQRRETDRCGGIGETYGRRQDDGGYRGGIFRSYHWHFARNDMASGVGTITGVSFDRLSDKQVSVDPISDIGKSVAMSGPYISLDTIKLVLRNLRHRQRP